MFSDKISVERSFDYEIQKNNRRFIFNSNIAVNDGSACIYLWS